LPSFCFGCGSAALGFIHAGTPAGIPASVATAFRLPRDLGVLGGSFCLLATAKALALLIRDHRRPYFVFFVSFVVPAYFHPPTRPELPPRSYKKLQKQPIFPKIVATPILTPPCAAPK